jgi:hypothetical protein
LAVKGAVAAGVAAVCLIPIRFPAAGALPANGGGAQLTGRFSVVVTGTSPKSVHGTIYHLSWSFTPECDSGPCAVQVDTLANSCPSGSCAQSPSQFDFAGAQLGLTGGKYRGTFVVKTGCNAKGEYLPYAYEQHTTLTLSAASSAEVGTIGTEPIRHVSAISGSLAIREASTRTRGCNSYSERFKLRGKVQR